MGPFYLIIAELMLWFSFFIMVGSLVYVTWNYVALLRTKLKFKKISLTFNLIFAFITLFLWIMIIIGSLWTYKPSNFVNSFTTSHQLSSSIIYTAISFVFSLVLAAYLFFCGKYFFISQKIDDQIMLFGLGISKKQVKFIFKKSLVNKEYQQLLNK